ncbi:MAG TPA: hypothetical protein VKF62_08025, partial [Planctomycetota bacterium]|nr:hypothetical protein [Planctomycetota bacterium]
ARSSAPDPVPWCPKCGNEYDSGVGSCADCGLSLVAERPSQQGERAGFVGLHFEREGDLDRVASNLDAASLPHARDLAPDGRGMIAIPLPLAAAAADRIDRDFPDLVLEPTEGGIQVRPHDPSRDREIRDHPLLREPWPRIEKGGSESRATLRTCLLRGSRAVREGARVFLRRFGPIAAADFATALREAVEHGDDVVAAEILHELSGAGKGIAGPDRRTITVFDGFEALPSSGNRSSEWPEEVRSLASLVTSSDPRVRRWGIRIAGRLRLRQAGLALVHFLAGVDPETAVEADEALTEITGVDLGYEPDLPPERIERIREERRRSLSGTG